MNKLYVRSLGKLSAVTLAALLVGCASQGMAEKKSAQSASPAVVAEAMNKERQSKVTPDAALDMLKQGNERFTSGEMTERDLKAQVKATGKGQYPFASIVSCIDSRTPPSLVFDQGIGDLFVASVAGNIVNPDILGSLEFASKVAGSKVIVVLGHTSCGAVKGACDNAKLGNLTQLVDKIRPAVEATPNVNGPDRSSKNYAFVNEAARVNVHLTVKDIMNQSPVLREMAEKGEIKIVGAMLDVNTGKVTFE